MSTSMPYHPSRLTYMHQASALQVVTAAADAPPFWIMSTCASSFPIISNGGVHIVLFVKQVSSGSVR